MAIGTQVYVLRNGKRVAVDIPEHTFTLYRKTVPTLAVCMNESFVVDTLEGKDMSGAPGDFLCKGSAGEFYPCDGTIFRDTHEELTTGLAVVIGERYATLVEEGESLEQTAARLLDDEFVQAFITGQHKEP